MSNLALGSGLMSFSDAFFKGRDRQDQRRVQMEESAMKKQMFDFQNSEMQAKEAQARREQAIEQNTNEAINGFMTAANPQQAQQILQSLDPSTTDMTKVLAAAKSVKEYNAPEKKDYKIVEFNGANGYGQYVVDPSNPSQMSFLGAGKQTTPDYVAIENADGSQSWLAKGQAFPQGAKISRPSAVNVNVGNPDAPVQTEKTRLLAIAGSGSKAIKSAEKMFFKDGVYNIGLAKTLALPDAAAASGVLGEEASQAYSAVFGAVQDKLRLESGAAIPEAEVKMAMRRYLPAPFDTEDSARKKLKSLSDTLDLYNELGARGIDVSSLKNGEVISKEPKKEEKQPKPAITSAADALIEKFKGGK